MEKSMLLDKLFALREEDRKEREKLLEKLDSLQNQLLALHADNMEQKKASMEDRAANAALRSLVKSLQAENASLKEQLKLSRRNLYGSKSQKSSRKAQPKSREEDKGDFDGNLPCHATSGMEEGVAQEASSRVKERVCGFFRWATFPSCMQYSPIILRWASKIYFDGR